MTPIRSTPRVVACAAALWLCGCSKGPPPIVPVEGVVLLNNQPLPHAEVSFVPMVADLGFEYVATGVTDESGRFRLTCNGRSGACSGESRVIVIDAPVPEEARGMGGDAQAAMAKYYEGLKNRPIPSKYATAASTPLTVTVTAGQTEYKIELKR
jgi:hypothetical protein